MRYIEVIRGIAVGVTGAAVLGLASAPQAFGQDDAIIVYSAGLEKMLVDDKDQGLAAALRLVNDRIGELPGELDEPEIPAPAIQFVYDVLVSPMLLRAGTVNLEEYDPASGAPPFYAQLNVLGEDADLTTAMAHSFHGMLEMMAGSGGEPAEGMDGLNVLDLDGVPFYHGTSPLGTKQTFTLALNEFHPDLPAPPELGLPDGVEPVFAMKVDVAPLMPLMDMMFAQMGPDADMMREQLELYGITGENPLQLVVAAGYGADRSYGTMRLKNYKPVLEAQGTLIEEPLTARHLQMLPADSTMAEVGRSDMGAIGDFLREMAAAGMMHEGMPEDADAFDMIAEQTGFHPQNDFFAHLGNTYGYYTSDATGGGGLLSAVMFVELSNPDGMRESFGKLAEMVNAIAQQQAKGYVRLNKTRHGDREMYTVMFPGLPIPLELTMAIAGRYMYAGITPHAVVAAIDQTDGDHPSLLDNPRFKEVCGDDWQDAMVVSFVDTARLARSGYGLTSLLMSALSNAVRSPSDPERDPGLIMPSFNDFIDGAKASVTITKLEGDDLTVSSVSDRSVLVNISAGIGILANSGGAIAGAALAGGLVMPALAKAQQNAKAIQSTSMIRQLLIAMHTYASDHRDASPPSMQAIKEYLGPGFTLQSPLGPVHDGQGDYWLNTTFKQLSQVQWPDRQIALYDRAMFANSPRGIAVGFFDGHVQLLELMEFLAMMEEDPNNGTDFNLPGG